MSYDPKKNPVRHDGQTAREQNARIDSNPHVGNTREYDHWQHGWLEADNRANDRYLPGPAEKSR